MKINLIILSLILALTAIATSLSTNWRPETTKGETAPNFTYETIKGAKGALYDHQEKIVLLHFWATWCAPCLVEFPDLISLAEEQKDNFVILAISADEEKGNIDRFLKKLKHKIPTNFILIQDRDKSISQELYGTYKLPESYLLSKDITIMEKIIGPRQNWNSAEWNQRIKALISE